MIYYNNIYILVYIIIIDPKWICNNCGKEFDEDEIESIDDPDDWVVERKASKIKGD